eukprot:TRINITY_DN9457_c0_g1_i3.p1 TRINITY_DN9457_c0_g1~~TRINITY_DN9457_c0_g1_i3.p1  ORF type:complete len:583 (-),score=111.68 TRINITY_DN9457_c0_g1_i3:158-1906(-)
MPCDVVPRAMYQSQVHMQHQQLSQTWPHQGHRLPAEPIAYTSRPACVPASSSTHGHPVTCAPVTARTVKVEVANARARTATSSPRGIIIHASEARRKESSVRFRSPQASVELGPHLAAGDWETASTASECSKGSNRTVPTSALTPQPPLPRGVSSSACRPPGQAPSPELPPAPAVTAPVLPMSTAAIITFGGGTAQRLPQQAPSLSDVHSHAQPRANSKEDGMEEDEDEADFDRRATLQCYTDAANVIAAAVASHQSVALAAQSKAMSEQTLPAKSEEQLQEETTMFRDAKSGKRPTLALRLAPQLSKDGPSSTSTKEGSDDDADADVQIVVDDRRRTPGSFDVEGGVGSALGSAVCSPTNAEAHTTHGSFVLDRAFDASCLSDTSAAQPSSPTRQFSPAAHAAAVRAASAAATAAAAADAVRKENEELRASLAQAEERAATSAKDTACRLEALEARLAERDALARQLQGERDELARELQEARGRESTRSSVSQSANAASAEPVLSTSSADCRDGNGDDGSDMSLVASIVSKRLEAVQVREELCRAMRAESEALERERARLLELLDEPTQVDGGPAVASASL